MRTLAKARLQTILRTKLRLREPKFVLRRIGERLSGSVISETFTRKTDLQRQRMIWDALDDEFGSDATHLVGTLLAYTPTEWSVDLEADAMAKSGK